MYKKCIKCGEMKLLNEFRISRKDRHRGECSACEREYNREWRQKNRKKVLLYLRSYNKEYYQRNKERFRLLGQRWARENREKMKISKAKWEQKNPEHGREYYKKNRENIRRKQKKYWQENKEKLLLYCKRWQQRNIEQCRKWRRDYVKHRRARDPKFRLNLSMGSAVYTALQENKAGRKWESLVGYTLQDLMSHLESQFDSSMSWENYGSHWHIDHIKPKSLFNYIVPEDLEFRKCWALDNLQPLEKHQNWRKNDYYNERKFIYDTPLLLATID